MHRRSRKLLKMRGGLSEIVQMRGAEMTRRIIVIRYFAFLTLCSVVLLGQQSATVPASQSAREFPVRMEQNVVAGRTSVGAKVRAKLQMATLVSSVVCPKDAVLVGEVIESKAKTDTDPSRVAIRMDSVEWKNRSVPIKVYLTQWYYPTTTVEPTQDLQYGPEQLAKKTWNGQGMYPPKSGPYAPFPRKDEDPDTRAPDVPTNRMSDHRVPMKNLDVVTTGEGTVALVSRGTNIKLDKMTVYVFAAGDLLAQK